MKGLIFWIIILVIFLIMKAIVEFLASIVTIEFIVNTFTILGIISFIYLMKGLK